MIKYYDKLILSLTEVDAHPSFLIHGLTGCKFHCYHCFNYDELIVKPHPDFYTVEDVIGYIQKQGDLFEYLLFSGGEFLLAPLDSLISDLGKIRKASPKPIIIYTTGIELEKMKKLSELKLVDGYHIDMKLPYHLLTDEDFDLIELTMGIKVKDLSLLNSLTKAIEFVVQHDAGYSRVRSVKYPFLGESAFEECREFIHELNEKYHKHVPYDANQFIYQECVKE
ncbi:MAG: radical SAM protein [Firmicutes bacterium]|nr:radical SAM protein [Bacillota bacterium]